MSKDGEMTRRNFLKAGAAGVALTMGACTSNQSVERRSGDVSLKYKNLGNILIQTQDLALSFDPNGTLAASLVVNGQTSSLTNQIAEGAGVPSDYVTVGTKDIKNFVIQYSQITLRDVRTKFGDCVRITIPSRASDGGLRLERTLHIDLCPSFPRTAVFTATYKNLGSSPLQISRVVQVSQEIKSPAAEPQGIWTFQGASLFWGRDNVFHLPVSFEAENPMGQILADGNGGGIPVNDYWNGQIGMASGHIEPEPVACWLPIETRGDHGAQTRLETRPKVMLAPGKTLTTPRSFVTVHRGDYYEPMATYSAMLRAQGTTFMKHPEGLYDPIWWTYAFGHNFRPAQVYGIIPKLKEFGIKWVIINNRWWDHYGDWMPRPDKFGGEAGFKEMIARLHQAGLKALIWWMPCGVQDKEFARSGLYNNPVDQPKQLPEVEKMVSATANVALKHRDWLIQDQQGKLVPIQRNLAAFCPAYPPVQNYLEQLAQRMLVDWKADGLYLDVTFPVPRCYNPAHHHASPFDSMRGLKTLFYGFRKVVEKCDPQGMIMICPCGNVVNHSLLPTMNEPVTADPVGSAQIRWRVKLYKALMGPNAPVFADRVESTAFTKIGPSWAESGRDFASCMGTGAVIGTIFVWPKLNMLPGDIEYRDEVAIKNSLLLTPDKDALWKKWFALYREKMISSGTFLDLYKVGFDVPEGYAIQKGGKMYYAFFTPVNRPWGLDKPPMQTRSTDQVWEGRLELRGLDKSKKYQIVDYEHGKSLGSVKGSNPFLNAKFRKHLVLEVTQRS